MDVSFEATHIVDAVEVTPELKQYYENYLTVLAQGFLDTETINHIEQIIVPEDFITAVIDFQKKHNDKSAFVTNNDFGRAYGKLLFNPDTDKYVVFIDVEFGAFIIDDIIFHTWFDKLDKKDLEIVKMKRQVGLNLFAHELAHVEFDLAVASPKYEKTLQSGLIVLAYNLLNEYYAHRRASVYYPRTLADDDEKYILDLEEKIDTERWKYKNRDMSLDDFCKEFHEYSEMALIRLVSVLGMYAAEGNDELPFSNTYLGKQAGIFKICFDMLFRQIIYGNEINESIMPINAIDSYYRDLGVIISETNGGFYYSIPD